MLVESSVQIHEIILGQSKMASVQNCFKVLFGYFDTDSGFSQNLPLDAGSFFLCTAIVYHALRSQLLCVACASKEKISLFDLIILDSALY